jgi:hypothetical protein
MKLLKFLGVLLLLAVAVSLVFNRGLTGKDTKAGELTLSVDLNQFSASMDEKDVQKFLPDIGLKCTQIRNLAFSLEIGSAMPT